MSISAPQVAMAPSTRTARTSRTPVNASVNHEVEETDDLALELAKAEERAALAVIKPKVGAPPLTQSVGLPVPVQLRFPLLVLGSLVLSAAGYGILGESQGGGELGSVSRRLERWWEVGGLLGWKM